MTDPTPPPMIWAVSIWEPRTHDGGKWTHFWCDDFAFVGEVGPAGNRALMNCYRLRDIREPSGRLPDNEFERARRLPDHYFSANTIIEAIPVPRPSWFDKVEEAEQPNSFRMRTTIS